jgi:Ca2+-transporting ATPase
VSLPSLNSPYRLTVDEVLRQLRVRADSGLTPSEVIRRRQVFGLNTLPKTKKNKFLQLIVSRLKDPLVLVLVGAAALAFFFGEYAETIIILAALLLDGSLSFLQIHQTEKALRKIGDHVRHLAVVRRQGEWRRIPASDLVVGDLIEIRGGEYIPADGRLIKCQALRTHEAALTGESTEVVKQTSALTSKSLLANQTNMVFMGTTAASGSAEVVVTATGLKTEYGKIAQVLRTSRHTATPLQQKVNQASLFIGLIVVLSIITLSIINLLQQRSVLETLSLAITLLVSAIPQDLTLIITVTLAVGLTRLSRRGGVVRKLASAETLGAATVICLDKTGTLTQGKMSGQFIDFLQGTRLALTNPPQHHYQNLALIGLVLTSNAKRLEGEPLQYLGSETERSALAFAESFGLESATLRQHWRQSARINFDSRWKFSASLCDHPRQATRTLFAAGSPEELLERSSRSLNHRLQPEAITSSERRSLQQSITTLASQGFRLLAVAARPQAQLTGLTRGNVSDLIFLGVLAIADPVRSDVSASLDQSHAAGLTVKIITGDSAATAAAVARQVGLTATAESIRTGSDLAELSNQALQALVKDTVIFARVTPLDKQRIVEALQANGEIVAMTGDGINDAVALKTADIGVAMGSGTDIAKDASDLVLINDSFTTIVSAVKEGRTLRDNLRKVISFLLSTNAAEVAIFFASLLFRLPVPLLPAQILWINLVTDGTSDLALAFEPPEKNVMNYAPESPRQPLLNKTHLWHIALAGLVTTVVTMLLYQYLKYSYGLTNLPYIRTMIFTFVSLSSLLSVWSWRSLYQTIFHRGLWQNRYVLLSALFSLGLQIIAIYLPAFQRLFKTTALSFGDWLLLASTAIVTVLLIDIRKLIPALKIR